MELLLQLLSHARSVQNSSGKKGVGEAWETDLAQTGQSCNSLEPDGSECFQQGRGPPLSPAHPRLQPHCFGYSVEGRVLNLAKYRATSVTTFAFWGSEDESHIPGFEAF